MAYDEGLAERLGDYFDGHEELVVKKMFGGLCFMVANHMCCGVINDTLMARVGPNNYDEYLQKPHAKEMDFTGKPMKGMIYVDPLGIQEDADLEWWAETCVNFVRSLPPKSPKKPKKRKDR